MSEFQNPEPEEKTFVDKLIDKGKQFIEETSDTGDVVLLLQQIVAYLKPQDQQPKNLIYRKTVSNTFSVGSPTSNLQNFLPIVKTNSYINILKVFFSCEYPTTVQFNDIVYYVDSNLEIENVRGENNSSVDLVVSTRIPLVAGHISGFSYQIHVIYEVKDIL